MTGTLQVERLLNQAGPAWLRDLRRTAFERFNELGFPTTHLEDWKYTNVSRIAKTEFEPGSAGALAPAPSSLAGLGCSVRLVFVNGHFNADLSSGAGSVTGVSALSLAEILRQGSQSVESHLARYAQFENHAFAALNTALAEDGAVVEIGPEASPVAPIHLVYISVPEGRPASSHPRNLILAGRRSNSAVIETYLGDAGLESFTNAVTEIVLGEGAVLDHYRIQQEGDRAYHVATVQAVQDRQSVLNSHNVVLGGALVRNDVNSVLDDEGAECVLNGLFFVDGNRHVDYHTLLDHTKPHCLSRELYKGILDGRGVGVFNGKIVVRKDAQRTNAIQSNRNLLLSGEAVINTKPQLEIFADDVRCTHGATVGQIDKDALFYLRSRGIGPEVARELLIHAFAGEVLERMRWQPVRDQIEGAMHQLLAREREETPR